MSAHQTFALNKWNIFLVCLLLLNGNATARHRHKAQSAIHFIDQNIDAALRLSKKLHKTVFVDAYAAWCVPCRELKHQTFRNRRIAAYFNTHYINIAVDVEGREGEKFADRYNVDSYPTLLFINKEGKVIKRIEGFIDAGQLETIARDIK